MVHRRELNGEEVVFGNQGDLFGNAMTWWDHDTGSVWSQPRGEAILGPLKGERLELLSSTLTPWSAWRQAHPDTLALDARGWRTGFHLVDMAIVVDLGEEAVAYRIPDLWEVGVVNDVVAGVEIAVVTDPSERQRWAVFGRSLGEQVVTLEVRSGELVDRDSGTVFDPVPGTALSGPLTGETLARLPGFTSFPSDFHTFFPDGRTWP